MIEWMFILGLILVIIGMTGVICYEIFHEGEEE